VGLPLEVATRLLTDRGFDHEVRSEHSAVFPPGVVTRQRPAAGEELAADGAVLLHASVATGLRRSPPDVLGASLDDAVERLEDDGWVVEVVVDCPCSQPPGTVHTQSARQVASRSPSTTS
jgi:beta-lactam-binding protein with PASTA domain